ncbi:Zinc finger BED domain-containing protein RICESLEEPER 3 [Dichanthelium oligosanthes]|uniref:Zinc finger BED domain-containing protein RICESLEEPER 3 n=1 Tax=Dichanthelium oligosanthes TaxID=888268 RepID=A0A1E5WMQ7_9POAL|nr:Zinc finger BED domain-containing protein RICESLEEPER 3 [Dichanthelium oligosanthes]
MGEPNSNDNAMVHDSEIVDGNGVIHGNEMVQGSEMIHGNEMVHGDEMIHGNEMIQGTEMVQGSEMIHGNEMVQVNDLIHGNEMVQVNDMVNGDEMAHGNELINAGMTLQTTTRRRRKKSLVWEHFTIEAMPGGSSRACCNLCKQTFAYSSGSKIAGTSHLKRHITLGSCPVMKDQDRKLALPPAGGPGTDNDGEGTVERPSKRRYRYTGYANATFDQERSSSYLAKMIILHDYPLHIVQQSAFTSFIDSLQPRFRVADVNTMEVEVYAVFQKAKENLLQAFSTMPGRISLTIGLWTTSQTLDFLMCTTLEAFDRRSVLTQAREERFTSSASLSLSAWLKKPKMRLLPMMSKPLLTALVQRLLGLAISRGTSPWVLVRPEAGTAFNRRD